MQIFVYGTLKKGDPNHFRLGSSEFICSTQTTDEYVMLDIGDFPGVLKQEAAPGLPAARIHGEVYNVTDKTLLQLDSYEGEWYFRDEAQLDNGISAQMYFLKSIPPVRYEIVINGNWIK